MFILEEVGATNVDNMNYKDLIGNSCLLQYKNFSVPETGNARRAHKQAESRKPETLLSTKHEENSMSF